MDLACTSCGEDYYPEDEEALVCFTCKKPLAPKYLCVVLGEEHAHFCSRECVGQICNEAELQGV